MPILKKKKIRGSATSDRERVNNRIIEVGRDFFVII